MLIYYHTILLYNTSHILIFIFLPLYLNIIFLIFLYSLFTHSLSLSLSLTYIKWCIIEKCVKLTHFCPKITHIIQVKIVQIYIIDVVHVNLQWYYSFYIYFLFFFYIYILRMKKESEWVLLLCVKKEKFY